jgi:hypothetical protein
MFSLLKPTFSLLADPQLFTLLLLIDAERSSTDFISLTLSANYLVPFILGAKSLDQ